MILLVECGAFTRCANREKILGWNMALSSACVAKFRLQKEIKQSLWFLVLQFVCKYAQYRALFAFFSLFLPKYFDPYTRHDWNPFWKWRPPVSCCLAVSMVAETDHTENPPYAANFYFYWCVVLNSIRNPHLLKFRFLELSAISSYAHSCQDALKARKF